MKNDIHTIDTTYIKSSRTIETIEVVNSDDKKKYFYMYNYEGIHFRLFPNILQLIYFFDGNEYECLEFEDENELDNYLLNLKFDNYLSHLQK